MNKLLKIIFIITIIYNINLFSNAREKVTLQFQWKDQFQFAGYYIAKEKGFYKKENLEVTFTKYTNDNHILDNVISQKSTFATGRTSLLIHKNNGYDVIALAAIFQHSPSILLVTSEKISTPNSLRNKKIMVSADAISSASYMSMLFSEGILNKDLIIQEHTFNINDLIEGKTDAIAAYISNEPYLLKKRGIKYKYFHPKDYGFDFYGDILYTSQKELDENPLRVKKFRKASIKGWEYAFNNIEETAKIIFNKYNIQNKTLEQLIYEGKILKNLAYDKNGKIGTIDKNKFTDIAKTYRLLGLIKKDYNLDNFIYNHEDTKKFILKKEEEEWLKNKKVIYLGTNKEWAPIEFFDKNEKYSGIASGYLSILEKKLDIKFKIQKNEFWHKMIEKIKNRKTDMFLAIVSTPDRNKYMNFTSSYLNFPTVIVTRDDVGYIKNLGQLSNKKVAVEKSFFTQELIHKKNKKIQLITTNTTKEALTKVYDGSAYAYIGTLPNIGHFIKELNYTNLKINGETSFETKLSFSTRKDLPHLNNILQKVLDTITEKEHDDIYYKWINITYTKTFDYQVIIISTFFIFLILLVFYYRNQSLEKELRVKEEVAKELKDLNSLLEQKNMTLRDISETDSLTKLANRRKIDSFLEAEIDRSSRFSLPLSILMIDIDFFKKVNDSYGHKIGDAVLKQIAQLLSGSVRRYDLVGRWGGEEFLIICPNSNIKQSYFLAEKIKDKISEYKFQNMNNKHITISCGISQYTSYESVDDLINKADKELYNAKHRGRNTICPKV